MQKIIVSLTALLAGAGICGANVTVQGWWHLDSSQPIADSSGNNRGFGSAYSTAPAVGGQVAAQVVNNGAGGPLDGTGYSSSQCIQVGLGVGGKRQSSMWGIAYNPPPQNYGIEIWVLPQDNGIAGGSGGWIFSSGQAGGVAFRINAPNGNPSYIDAFILGTSLTVGSQVPIDTNNWMHLALVNANGITTFYTNGVPCGPSDTNNATASSGDAYMISAPGDNQAFYGYLDEGRMFTFASGAFSTNDLLLRPAGPQIITQPQSAVVWNRGAAPFSVNASFSGNLAYQWLSNGTNLPGATSANLTLPVVTPADNGSTFACKLTSGSLSVTSSVASLTVVQPNVADVNAYRNLITSEPSLLAYFPVDGSTGTVVTNTVSAAFNGTLELNADYDGRTNRAFGERALSFNADGDVQIPNNAAYEFPSGNGTVEALVYLSRATVSDPTFFAECFDQNPFYYALRASANGSFLLYTNNNGAGFSWPVPGGMIGRWAHVAFVFDHGTNVTPYVNGQSLGTQVQIGFGTQPGGPAWIGSVGTSVSDNRWAGTVDELAVYSTALSAGTVQSHYTKFFYGTNNAPPVILSQPSSKTMLAGGSPTLVVNVGGALPFTFQWTSNNTAIPGANSPTLTLARTETSYSATYNLWVTNVFGTASTQPIVLTFTAPPAGYVSKVMSDDPTAFWRLAETAGPTLVDSAGLYDGTYAASGVTYGGGGFAGDAGAGAAFNGSAGRALVPNSPAFNPNAPFTIEFWGQLASYGFFVPVSSMNRPSRDSGYEFYIDGNYPGYEFHTAAGGGYNMITGDGNVPPNGDWTYVVGVYDGSNIFLYVNGQLGNIQTDPPLPAGMDNWVTEGAPPFVPNTAKSFYIGSRSDDSHFWHGAIGDVAFYNYALTPSQITNHWSFGWVASHVVSSPAGVTNTEGSTITLTPVVTGIPNTYQWYKNGVALTSTLNFDQTPHYPQDVTNITLVISEAVPTDSGQYHLVISNPLGQSTTVDAKVLITADTNPPAITYVAAPGTPNANGPTPYLVKVAFDKRVDATTAGNPANYALNPPVTISTATVSADVKSEGFGGDWRTVFLATAGLSPGQKYTLTASGIKDQAQTPNTMATGSASFHAPVLTAGKLDWDYYYLGSPVSGIGNLVGNINYPGAPQTNLSTSIFDTTQITTGDLNNVPQFGGTYGDNYGDSLSGWITPTVSGDYTFFIASDDASQLLLSTDANPANVVTIAQETGCCNPFLEPPAGQTSVPISLLANTRYFIQALHTEGGGGDYVKVAWRSATDTTAAASLPPIQSSFLSAYLPLPAPQFNSPTFSGGHVTISWTGVGTLYQSTDLKNWTPVPGNPPSPYVVTPGPGPYLFYRLVQ